MPGARAKVTTLARFAKRARARPGAVRQSIKLAAASGYRARAILNLENGSSLVSPNPRSVARDSRRGAIWIRPCPPNQFHQVPLTIEGVCAWWNSVREVAVGCVRVLFPGVLLPTTHREFIRTNARHVAEEFH